MEAGKGMPDYIYLLENRLSADQQSALRHLRQAAQEAGTILFLTGDAVRDLTSGHAVRDLEVMVHGNALKLKKTIEKLGGKVWGEDESLQALYLCFPGTVRVDLVSTHRVEYVKPGKLVYHPASIQEDLRRRDFTVNAMALSLNEGSFGLLMDPMNGAADIESRSLRLVSNYGFLEEPSLLIRATRYQSRLGWEMEPKTLTRYTNAKEEGVIEHLSAHARRYELEQIGHEEDGLKVLKSLESEGWMEHLFPAWTGVKADEEQLAALHELAVELLVQGVHADMSAAQMRLLTAKLAPKDLIALKKQMLRPGFVEEWHSLDTLAAGFAKALLAKENAVPSACFKLFLRYDPEAILWLGFTTKDEAVKERFNLFLKVWPELRQRIPHALMLEMRITSELPAYKEIVEAVFLELLDGKLETPEEARAFLEPHSPPAPPPQVTIKRPRVKRGSEPKIKDDSFDDEESEEALDDEEDLDDIGGEDDEIDLGMNLPKIDVDVDLMDDSDEGAEDEDEEEHPKPAKTQTEREAKSSTKSKAVTPPAPVAAGKPQPPLKVKEQPKPAMAAPAKPKVDSKNESKAKPPVSVKPAVKAVKPPASPARSSSKPQAAKALPPAKKAASKPDPKKVVAKVSAKPQAKVQAKATNKTAPAKKKPVSSSTSKPAQSAKASGKRPVAKPAKKR
ncbi:MAG: CCA tRNA nucleotidyltransferase [Terracidiphilus sp.]